MKEPPLGLSTKCKVLEVYDGDTVTVEIVRTVRVRLLDCWAPEIRTKNQREKAKGWLSKAHLKNIIEGKNATLFVPTENMKNSGDITSMGRVLGHLWPADEPKNVSQLQVEAGHATETKQK